MTDSARDQGWTRVAFGDVVRLSRERSSDPSKDGLRRYVGLEHLDPGDLKVRSWGDIADGTTFTSVFHPGQVLFGKRRAYQRKVAVADFDGVCSGDIYVFESKDGRLLPDLMPFICQTDGFFGHAVGTSAGSLSPRTNWQSLAKYEFDLPPLEEQRRMAAAFDAVEMNLTTLGELAVAGAALRESFATHLWSDCSGPNTLKPLSEACVKIQDGTHLSPKSSQGGYRYVTSKNIRDGYLDLSEVGWISEAEHLAIYRRCDVRFGDVLLTKDGANAGNVAMNDLEEPFSLLSSVAFIRTDPDVLMPRYVFEYLRSRIGRARILSSVKGSAITRLVLAQIRGIAIPVPPMTEQADSCERFLESDAALGLVKARIEATVALRRHLLAQLGSA